MKTILGLLLTVFLCSAFAIAQGTPKATVVLHVEVENGKTLDLKASDLAALPRKEVKAVDHDGKESTYGGFSLTDVLALAGAKFGKEEVRGKELAKVLIVDAVDGYKATFAIAELSPDFTDRIILLSDTFNGQPIDDKHGPWQIIVPNEKKWGRWVRQVTGLKLKTVQ